MDKESEGAKNRVSEEVFRRLLMLRRQNMFGKYSHVLENGHRPPRASTSSDVECWIESQKTDREGQLEEDASPGC